MYRGCHCPKHHKIRYGGICTNEESNSFLVHSVFPDPLGPVTIIENGCLNVISFNGCDWSVYFPLPWTLRSCLCNASRLLKDWLQIKHLIILSQLVLFLYLHTGAILLTIIGSLLPPPPPPTTTTTTTNTTTHSHHMVDHCFLTVHSLYPHCTPTEPSSAPMYPHCIITVPHCTLTVSSLYPHCIPTEPSLCPNVPSLYPTVLCIPTVSFLYPQCILLPSSSSLLIPLYPNRTLTVSSLYPTVLSLYPPFTLTVSPFLLTLSSSLLAPL